MKSVVLFSLILLVGFSGCKVSTKVPDAPLPKPAGWDQPQLGPEPTVYGPLAKPNNSPCNGPRCPQR